MVEFMAAQITSVLSMQRPHLIGFFSMNGLIIMNGDIDVCFQVSQNTDTALPSFLLLWVPKSPRTRLEGFQAYLTLPPPTPPEPKLSLSNSTPFQIQSGTLCLSTQGSTITRLLRQSQPLGTLACTAEILAMLILSMTPQQRI